MSSDLTRKKIKARYNIESSLLLQFVTMVCGIITPRLLLGAFGSEINGACSSITQFLAYISLIEGGIAGVARAALYKPLNENDGRKIGNVLNEIRHFFQVIGIVFIAYVLFVAVTFKRISGITCLEWSATFILVIAISISTFAQYFIGISNAVLLQADQKTYIVNVLSVFARIIDCILIVMLVKGGANVIVVKFSTSIIFAMKSIAQWIYVKRKYQFVNTKERDKKVLEQKWTAFGQHIAYFLNTNTDVMVLTVFVGLKTVSVYSVYYMVISAVQGIATSFSSGMEAFFGSLLAGDRKKELSETFDFYETLISFVTITLFGITAVLITPFVQLYTKGITDANYYQPVFGLLLLSASVLFCIRQPYHSMVMAAGHFKQTRVAAYGEAILNVLISVILVNILGLCGVAIGTIIATAFRMIYYVIYLKNNIIYRKIQRFVKQFIVNFISLVASYTCGCYARSFFSESSYWEWLISACVVAAMTMGMNLIIARIFYPEILRSILKKIFKRGN